MNNTIIKISAYMIAFGFIFGFIFGLILISSVPFYLLWNWIMPLFGLPNLSIIQSIGFLTLLNLLTLPYTYKNNK